MKQTGSQSQASYSRLLEDGSLAERVAETLQRLRRCRVCPRHCEVNRLQGERGNTSSYDDLETLRLLDGIVDIYLPDFKYADAAIALKYSKVESYPETAKKAIKEMHRQVGELVLDEEGIAVRGVLVRHLVLPGGLAGTAEVMRFLAEEISRDTYVNIMDQYRPCFRAAEFPPLNRTITRAEFDEAVQLAKAHGLHRLHRERPGTAIAWLAEL